MAIGLLLPGIVIDSFGTHELVLQSYIKKWDKMTLNQIFLDQFIWRNRFLAISMAISRLNLGHNYILTLEIDFPSKIA